MTMFGIFIDYKSKLGNIGSSVKTLSDFSLRDAYGAPRGMNLVTLNLKFLSFNTLLIFLGSAVKV